MSGDYTACGKKAQLRVVGDLALMAHSSVNRNVDFYCIEPVGHDQVDETRDATPHKAIVMWNDEGSVAPG